MDSPGTLEHEKASLAGLADLPDKVEEAHEKQVGIALQILAEKVKILGFYKDLYAPVQGFIDTHPTASERFGLRFEVGLSPVSFPGLFIDRIHQGRKGTFYGDQGRHRAEELVAQTEFEDPAGCEGFLRSMFEKLHSVKDDKGEEGYEPQDLDT